MTAGRPSGIIPHPSIALARWNSDVTEIRPDNSRPLASDGTVPDADRPGRDGRHARCPRGDRDLRSVTELRQAAPLRICIFGATAQTGWLSDVADGVPANATLALFGRWAAAESADARIARHAAVEPADGGGALRAAAAAYP